jgi:hypothetical protein
MDTFPSRQSITGLTKRYEDSKIKQTSASGRVVKPRSFLSSSRPPPIMFRASSLTITNRARSFRSGMVSLDSIDCNINEKKGKVRILRNILQQINYDEVTSTSSHNVIMLLYRFQKAQPEIMSTSIFWSPLYFESFKYILDITLLTGHSNITDLSINYKLQMINQTNLFEGLPKWSFSD